MSTMFKFSGNEDFYPGGSLCANPLDSSLFLSLGSHVDVYCPPRKRSRISAPFVFRPDKLEKTKLPSIEVLPDECLFEIFRRLPGGQERSSSACVSKRWLMLLSHLRRDEIPSPQSSKPESGLVLNKPEEECLPSSNDGHLTRSLEGKKATDIRLAAIAVGTSSRGGLGKLSIRGSNLTRGVTNLGLSSIARGCPSLRALSLWNLSSVGDEGLSEIAKGCHMLEKLDLCQCPSITDKGLHAIAENCPNLTDLTLVSCSKIGNVGLQAIGKCCPFLKSISIKDCPLVGDQGITSLVSSASCVLTKVKIQDMNITDVSLAVLGHYGKAVTDIVLTGLQNVSERGFWVMGSAHGLQKLKSFTITSCHGVTDVGLEAIGKGCPNLKQLCLRNCSLSSDKGLVACAQNMKSLESLHLEECNGVTQCGVLGVLTSCGVNLKALTLVKCTGIKDSVLGFPLLSQCMSLRSLSIRNCPGFGNASLALIGMLCPQLHNVDLSGLTGITDRGVLPLVQSSNEGLVKVNFSGCTNLTDAVVLAMTQLHGGSLEVLNLEGCKKITDASLVAIADNCLFLKDLDISKCAITDFGIASLSDAKQINLQILSLFGCSHVSDESIPFLANIGRTLVGLNIQNCNSLTTNAIDLLVEHLWRCDILS